FFKRSFSRCALCCIGCLTGLVGVGCGTAADRPQRLSGRRFTYGLIGRSSKIPGSGEDPAQMAGFMNGALAVPTTSATLMVDISILCGSLVNLRIELSVDFDEGWFLAFEGLAQRCAARIPGADG